MAVGVSTSFQCTKLYYCYVHWKYKAELFKVSSIFDELTLTATYMVYTLSAILYRPCIKQNSNTVLTF